MDSVVEMAPLFYPRRTRNDTVFYTVSSVSSVVVLSTKHTDSGEYTESFLASHAGYSSFSHFLPDLVYVQIRKDILKIAVAVNNADNVLIILIFKYSIACICENEGR